MKNDRHLKTSNGNGVLSFLYCALEELINCDNKFYGNALVCFFVFHVNT